MSRSPQTFPQKLLQTLPPEPQPTDPQPTDPVEPTEPGQPLPA